MNVLVFSEARIFETKMAREVCSSSWGKKKEKENVLILIFREFLFPEFTIFFLPEKAALQLSQPLLLKFNWQSNPCAHSQA